MLFRTLTILGMFLALPPAIIVLFHGEWTSTQLAFGAWLVWGVPIATLVRTFHSDSAWEHLRVLGAGWGATLAVCLVAAAIFPHYRVAGPHEYAAMAVFALAVALTIVTWRKLRPLCEGRVHQYVALVLAVLIGGASLWIGQNEAEELLPFWAYPVHADRHHDIVGIWVDAASAPISNQQLLDIVREYGLEERTPSRDLGWPKLPFWFHDESRTPVDLPERVYVDPRLEAEATEQYWCYFVVAQRRGTTYISRGCSWM